MENNSHHTTYDLTFVSFSFDVGSKSVREGAPAEIRSTECSTMWRKEAYHGNYTKSPILPDDREDITEYVELLAMIDNPGTWDEQHWANCDEQ